MALGVIFPEEIASGMASVSRGVGTISGSPIIKRTTMTVNLTGVADVQTLGVTLSSVASKTGSVAADATVPVNMLIGDTTGDKVLEQHDLNRCNLQVGDKVKRSTLRNDVNADGVIDASDV